MSKINTVILGASGYTGAELIRFLLVHSNVNIVALTGESQAGKPMGEVYPHLAYAGLPDLIRIDDVDFANIDLVFCCLPHGTTQEIIASLPSSIRIVDLSADFRLYDVDIYAKWYGHDHFAAELQKQAVYGLSEHNREAIKSAKLVANPGCYPTSSLLPLLPLLNDGLLQDNSIIIDAKSGVSGAGRAVKRQLNFCEISGGISAYGVANHRHIPEIEQELSNVANKNVEVNFTPHLIPMTRGMLTTIYTKLANGKTIDDVRGRLAKFYENERFVYLLSQGKTPATHNVRATNNCHINVFVGRRDDEVILVSAIDNLVKGASGQAVQNMNIMFGFDEKTGLESGAVFP